MAKISSSRHKPSWKDRPFEGLSVNPDALAVFEEEGVIAAEDITFARNERPSQTFARKFKDLIAKGASPGTAAKQLGTSLTDIGLSKEMRGLLTELVKNYAYGADMRREMVRAGFNKTFMEAVLAGDAETVLAAGQAIGKDPEVGLNAPPQVNFELRIEALGDLLAEFQQETEGVIVDASYTHEAVEGAEAEGDTPTAGTGDRALPAVPE